MLAQRIQARAFRRCGQLLAEIEKAQGANQNISEGVHTNVLTRKQAAEEAGMSKHQQVQSLRVANVSEEDFDEQVESQPNLTKALTFAEIFHT
jgi:hypothetical protein